MSLGGTTTLSDSTLQTDGSVSGTVTAAGGALPGICVAAIPVGLGTTPVYSVSGRTGSYSIGDLPAGHYRVQFSSGCDASGYRTQRWHGQADPAHGDDPVRELRGGDDRHQRRDAEVRKSVTGYEPSSGHAGNGQDPGTGAAPIQR